MKPYKRKRLCPKCHAMYGTTEYQNGYHGAACAFPDAERIASYANTRPMMAYPKPDPEVRAQIAKNDDYYLAMREAIPEHFERVCPNCKHRWAEAVC